MEMQKLILAARFGDREKFNVQLLSLLRLALAGQFPQQGDDYYVAAACVNRDRGDIYTCIIDYRVVETVNSAVAAANSVVDTLRDPTSWRPVLYVINNVTLAVYLVDTNDSIDAADTIPLFYLPS